MAHVCRAAPARRSVRIFSGPSKYAILPQHVDEEDLIAGNALLEMGTFVAILLGTICGGIIAGSEVPWILAPLIIAIAVVGYVSSRFIPKAAPPAPDLTINWNPISQIIRSFSHTKKHHYSVLLSILGVSWFWLMGSVYVTQIPNYVAEQLNGGTGVVTLLLAAFSTGIGIGALLCDRLCGHKIEVGLVPFGALGLSIAAIHLTTLTVPTPSETYDIASFLAVGGWRIIMDLVLLSLFGAFFVVPLNAFVQFQLTGRAAGENSGVEQSDERSVHADCRRGWCPVAHPGRTFHSSAVSGDGADERRRVSVHFSAGAPVCRPVPGLAAQSYGLSGTPRRAGEDPGIGTGHHRL